MKTTLKLVVLLCAVCAAAEAQVAPAAAVGAAYLNYSFHYAQTAEIGGELGDWQMSNFSGDISFANGSGRLPLVLEYGGGYSWTIAGPSYGSGLFQHFNITQGLNWHKWNLQAGDDVTYRQMAPVGGFLGVPGTGEPIGGAGTNPPTTETVLTLHTPMVTNVVSGQAQHILNYAASINFGGDSELMRFPDGNGIENNGQSAFAGLSERLNARNSLTERYTFSYYTYPDFGNSFMSNAAFFGVKRVWTPKVTTEVSAGPQWTSNSSGAAATATTVAPFGATVPSTTTVAVNATANYQYRGVAAGLDYTRGSTGGSGYLLGGEQDSVTLNLAKQFGRNWNIGLNGAYRRMTGIEAEGIIDAKYGGAQATWRIGRYLTTFANYTAESQSSSVALPGNALNGLVQIFGFGVGYAPRERHFTH